MYLTGVNYKDYGSLTFKKSSHGITAQDVTDGNLKLHFADGDESTFLPLQFHFHAPSEHTVDGQTYDLEMHIVHLYPDNSLGAVIGVFFDMAKGGSTENPFINEVKPQLAQYAGYTTANVNLASFLKTIDFTSYYSYDGSLTTPPCTEGIKWSVIQEVQPISAEQLASFTDLWAGN
jgi:carbonic anhydrase